MKTLYWECNMGAAGDMLTASLLELHPNPTEFVAKLNQLNLPGVAMHAHPAEKCGITGTRFSVTIHGEEEHSHDCNHAHLHPHESEHVHGHAHDHAHNHEHAHSHDHNHDTPHHSHAGMHEIQHIVKELLVPDAVKENILAVYAIIADAESKAHGVPVDQVHFHEVGAMDAVADITAACWLLHELAPQQILASPIHVGSGQVRCAHGILPVPAPATAEILHGVPIYGGAVQGELCTPTGAALLRHFVNHFGNMPVMKTERLGWGMGTKDFAQANCVRAFWGDTAESGDEIAELACNLDDMPAEDIGFVQQVLFDAGALEVYVTPVQMKKNRPGVLLSCMCRRADGPRMAKLMLRHTTTLGVRENISKRYTLRRTVTTQQTVFGPVGIKRSEGTDILREKWEYEDIARIAREKGLSLAEVRAALNKQ